MIVRLLALLLLLLLPSSAGATELAPLRSIAPVVPSEGVHVAGADGRFLYVVDGAPQTVRGMGYNAILTGLPEPERATRLARDFALMRRVGVNTVIGWDQAMMDRTFLDLAHAYDLGVVMHFELGKSWDYADPALRADLLEQIGAWVEEHRDHPAVRMWGVGNEVMLVMSPEECQSFAEFYADVYRTVRDRDQSHPVVYREAEDVRVPYFRDAFATAGLEPEGFVFGMNFYTPRVAEALADFAEHGFDVPVLVSEFAPAGLSPASRPHGFRDMWQRVREHERLVIGATPYVWTTEGPEAVDRIFGLTDADGNPVDWTLHALQRLYRGAFADDDPLPEPSPRATRARDGSLNMAIVQAMARGIAQHDVEEIDLTEVEAEARERYARDLAATAPGWRPDHPRMQRMLDLLVSTSVLAALSTTDGPVYPGAVEALPLLAGMARWAAVDPAAEAVAEDFLAEVLDQALRA